MGWFNHQLDYDYQVRPSNPPIVVSSILWISDYQSSSCKVGTSECYVAGRCLDRRWSGFPLWKRRGTYCWCFRNPANSLYVKYPIVYRVLYIPNGAGFLPSTLFPGEYEGTLMWHCHLRIDNDVLIYVCWEAIFFKDIVICGWGGLLVRPRTDWWLTLVITATQSDQPYLKKHVHNTRACLRAIDDYNWGWDHTNVENCWHLQTVCHDNQLPMQSHTSWNVVKHVITNWIIEISNHTNLMAFVQTPYNFGVGFGRTPQEYQWKNTTNGTPQKTNEWNLKITSLKRNIIFQSFIFGFNMLIFH